MSSNRIDPSAARAQLVARIAERIRMSPDPALIALAQQIRVAREIASDTDDRVIRAEARNDIARWTDTLAASAELADLEHHLLTDTDLQLALRRSELGDIGRYGAIGAVGAGAWLLNWAVVLPSALEFVLTIAFLCCIPFAAFGNGLVLHYYVVQRGPEGRTNRAWPRIVEDAAVTACARRDEDASDESPAIARDLERRRADAARALDDLNAAWGHYKLDTEAWYLTKPLLHDTTGTVGPTVAYTTAMADLTAAVDALGEYSTANDVDHALALADTAWAAWHDANDHAAAVGLDDRSPTERAALQRLNKLVTRLTRSSADDPELAAVKRDIIACLDRINTVSVSWADIAALPALDQRLIPQLSTGAA